MKFLNLLIIAILIIGTGCSNRDEVSLVNDNLSPETKSLIENANALERDIDEGRILRSSTERDKNSLKASLQSLKTSILRLDKNPNDKNALLAMARVFTALDSNEVQVLEQDRSLLDSFIDQARRLYSAYSSTQISNGTISAQELDTAAASYTWSLFRDNFTDKGIDEEDRSTLANFSIKYAQKGSGWGTGTNTISPTNGDHVFVTQGSAGAWMMTTCDLSNVRNPAFQIAHLFMINKGNNAKFSKPQEIIRDAFLVFASTEYAGGNPGDPRTSPIWNNVNIASYGGMPSGVDFHRAVSPEISLAPYAGQRVTLGFYFDFNQSLHQFHFVRWQIDHFELFGNSSTPTNCSHPEIVFSDYVEPPEVIDESIVYKQDFTKEIGEFDQVTLEGDPILFQQREYQGNKYIEVSGFSVKANGTQLFYSPEVDLKDIAKPAVSVAQTGKFYPEEAQELDLLQVVVAEVEEGKTVEQLNWETIPFKQIPSWQDYTIIDSEFFALPNKYLNKKVRVGFRYQSIHEQGYSPKWQINGITIKNLED